MSKWHILFIIILFGNIIAAYRSYKKYKVYLIRAQNEIETNQVRSFASNVTGIDIWDNIQRGRNVTFRIMVPPDRDKKFLKLLKKHNIRNEVIINDVQKMIEDERNLNSKPSNNKNYRTSKYSTFSDFEHFWTYDEVNKYLEFLKVKFSKYIEVSTLGQSEERREIQAIRIIGEKLSKRPQTIVIDATIHAREWISTMVAVYTIYELAEKRNSNIQLLMNTNWIIVPIVNPDGYVYTHTEDRFSRKTRTKLNNTKCIGIDANRNFDFKWDIKGGASPDPCAETYRGPVAGCAKEVVSLSNLFKNITNAKLYLTFHSYGELIMYPFSYTTDSIKNHKEYERIAKPVAKIMNTRSPIDGYKAHYRIGSISQIMYVASGGSVDYALVFGNFSFAYVIELPGGKQGFDISPNKILGVVVSTFNGIKVFGMHFQK